MARKTFERGRWRSVIVDWFDELTTIQNAAMQETTLIVESINGIST